MAASILMRTRYILRDSGENFYIFASVNDLIGWVEAIDVVNHEYAAWDDNGRVYKLTATDPHGDVSMLPTDTVDAEGLKTGLAAYVDKVAAHHQSAVPDRSEWGVKELVNWVHTAG
jgi:hypothetical protein